MGSKELNKTRFAMSSRLLSAEIRALKDGKAVLLTQVAIDSHRQRASIGIA